jgi:hypothetical protein
MKEQGKIAIRLMNDFLLNIVPYIIIFCMAISIDDIVNNQSSKNVIFISAFMLSIRYLYYLYEICRRLKEYKNNRLKEEIKNEGN